VSATADKSSLSVGFRTKFENITRAEKEVRCEG